MRRWFGALACALALFVLAPAAPVAAHAAFLTSDPVDGSVLAEPPAVAELRFSEGVFVDASRITLLSLGSGRIDQLKLGVAHNGSTLLADLPKLERGGYILRYVAVDPADLHKTVGSISFGVGVAAPPSVSGEQLDSSWLSVGLRVATDLALMLSVGALVIVVLLVRRGRRGLDQVTRLAVFSGCVVAVGWIGLLAADATTVGFRRVNWGSLLVNSDPGRRAVFGVQLAIGMWLAVGMLRRGRNHDSQWFVVRILTVIAGGFVVAGAYGGHAGIGGSFIVGVALRSLHLASLGVWIGAVAAMWLLGRRDRQLRELWSSISRLAAIGLATTGASGLLLSGRVSVTVTALLGTSYGQRIVIKAGLLIALSVLGGMAARRVRRGRDPRRLPAELGLAGIAVVLAALLASSAPARGEQFLPLPTVEPQIDTADLSDLTVSASIQPARPGENLVQLRVLDTRRPSPGPVEAVSVKVTSADGRAVAERGGVPVAGLVEWADVAIPNPGTYRVEVNISRPAQPVGPFMASWEVDATPVARAARVVSTRLWAPFAAGLAAAWMVVVALGWTVMRRLTGTSADEP
jgi:methionine-rich copper-binding protein CopC/putative copper export protein